MSKSLNLSKVLLASLAPIIAHQTTYGMIIQQQPQQQQVDETPILLQGVNLIQNPVAMPNNNAFVNGVAAGMLAAIPQNAQSGVFVAIAKWKTELANAQNQNPLVWNNLGRGVLANAQNNNSAELQRVVNAFNTAVVINTDPNNAQQALNLAQIKQAYNNNQGYTQNIYTPLATLAKSLYEFRKSDQQWNDLDNLKKLYMIIIAEQHFDPGQGNVQIDQAQNIHKEYLQQVLSDAIDEFISSLNKWKFETPVLFSQRQANNAQDTQQGVDKFIKFKEETLDEWNEFVSLDQFYQFSNTQAHLADLNTLEPVQFMNPNILNTHIAVGNNLLCNKIASYVDSRIEDLTILDNGNEPLNQQRHDDLLNLVDGAQFSINKYVRAEKAAIEAQKGDTFNVNQQIGQNFSRETIDALHDKIVAKLAGEVHATPKMVQDYLDKQNNQNQSVFDGILTLQLNNYANINTIDDLADAVVDAFHNDGQNHTIQDLTGTAQNPGPLFAYKVSDSDYVKKSLQQIQGQNNPNYDPKIEAELDMIDDYCQTTLRINNLDRNQMYTTQPVNDRETYIQALKTNYPKQITNEQQAFIKDTLTTLYLILTKLKASDNTLLTGLLEAENPNNDITTYTNEQFDQHITNINNHPEITRNYIQAKYQLIPQAHVDRDYIRREANTILSDNNLKPQITNALIQGGTLIKKDAISIANSIINTPEIATQLEQNNAFSQKYIRNNENIILQKYGNTLIKRTEHDRMKNDYTRMKQEHNIFSDAQRWASNTQHGNSTISSSQLASIVNEVLNLPKISKIMLKSYKNEIKNIIEPKLATKSVDNSTSEEIAKYISSSLKAYIGNNDLQQALRTIKYK